jgi:hypothetical protein
VRREDTVSAHRAPDASADPVSGERAEREGEDLEAALHKGFEVFDGFFTFLMGTHDKLALVREAFAAGDAALD